MENDAKIKKYLLDILTKLKKFNILNENTYETYCEEISSYSVDDLFHVACRLLYIALKNPRALGLVKESFNELYNIASLLVVPTKVNPDIKGKIRVSHNFLVKSQLPIMIDGHFEDDMISNGLAHRRLKVFTSEKNKSSILEELYCLGADVYEVIDRPLARLSSDAVAVFLSGLEIEVFTAKYVNGDLCVNLSFADANGNDEYKTMVYDQSIVPYCCKDGQNGVKIESAELMFADCISRGRIIDFIEEMNLSNKIDIKKVVAIRKGTTIKAKDEKEKMRHGL